VTASDLDVDIGDEFFPAFVLRPISKKQTNTIKKNNTHLQNNMKDNL
jgi:hypothetical protein